MCDSLSCHQGFLDEYKNYFYRKLLNTFTLGLSDSERDGLEEFIRLIESGMRCVLVTERPVDMRKLDETNTIFVLELPEGFRTATGSRGGGFGNRRVLAVYQFYCGMGECKKMCEFDDKSVTEILELPYHAAAFPIILPNGTEKFVSGVVDVELVEAYSEAVADAKLRGTSE